MGEHSKPREGRIRSALTWALTNRRRIALAALLALPLVARYVPEFPTEEAVRLLKLVLGSA